MWRSVRLQMIKKNNNIFLLIYKSVEQIKNLKYFYPALCDEAMEEFDVDLATDTDDPLDIGGRVRIKTKFSGLS